MKGVPPSLLFAAAAETSSAISEDETKKAVGRMLWPVRLRPREKRKAASGAFMIVIVVAL